MTQSRSSNADFLADLRRRIGEHQSLVKEVFSPLDAALLNRQPAAKEWSALQCVEHLNLTHRYYWGKISPALVGVTQSATGGEALYRPSFWGRIYMYFGLKEGSRFASPAMLNPGGSSNLTSQVLTDYLDWQKKLLSLMEGVERDEMLNVRVPIQFFVVFALGDCLKILTYHDRMHMHQAQAAVGR